MKIWRERPGEILADSLGPTDTLPPEVEALGAVIVDRGNGPELITAQDQFYQLVEGGIVTIRNGVVGYNTRDRIERKYAETQETATTAKASPERVR